MMEGGVTAVATPKPAGKGKAKAKAKPPPTPMAAEDLAGLLNEASDSMTAHKEGVDNLKQQRRSLVAEKRVITKQIKNEKKSQAKKDKVMAKRTTWSLVAELEKRMAAKTSREAAQRGGSE